MTAAQPEQGRTRRILVTGSRRWTDEAAIREGLAPYFAKAPYAVLVSGAARSGADLIAERIWKGWGGEVERHPADWKQGKSAGFRRNAEMVRSRPDACVAFILDDSPGATHAAKLSEAAGIPVDRHEAASEVTPAMQALADAGLTPATPEKRQRHSWKDAGPSRKTCASCGTLAVRRRLASSAPGLIACGFVTEYAQGGKTVVSSTGRVPACGPELPAADWEVTSPEDRPRLADDADRAAHEAYLAGDLDRAGRLVADARALDPARAATWDQRDAGIRRAAGQRGRTPLQREIAERLAKAGVQPDDPGLRQWAEHNSALQVEAT